MRVALCLYAPRVVCTCVRHKYGDVSACMFVCVSVDGSQGLDVYLWGWVYVSICVLCL